MNYFIFQAIPAHYDLRERIIEGLNVTWYATRYRKVMAPGDIVFFWLGGEKQFNGIYGWGNLISIPYARRDSYGVDVLYQKRLTNPILVNVIKTTPELENLLILRAPMGTNFLISEQEARSLANLIDVNQRPEVL
jgi:hypothetical protein